MKNFGKYLVSWIAVVILFNLISFLVPSGEGGKYTGAFWAGYAFIMLAFLLHLVYAYFACSKNDGKQVFHMSIVIVSYFELGLMILVGGLCMAIPGMPYWLGIILCYAVLACSVVFMASASAVGEVKTEGNRALNARTSQMRELTDLSEELMNLAKTPETKEVLRGICEAIRYSDLSSSAETREDETKIEEGLNEIRSLLSNGDENALKQKADDLQNLIQVRNRKCRARKRQE